MEQTKSRYEEFKENAKSNIDLYRETIKGNGGFEYSEQSDNLFKLQNCLNSSLFIYMFGEQLGNHYIEKFIDSKRNLLTFFKIIDSEAKFFMLHELKTNKNLFANG